MDFPICTTPIAQLVKNEDVDVAPINRHWAVWGWFIKNNTVTQRMIVGFTENPRNVVKLIYL